ncbi:alpha-1,4-glucan--maltose-1-phosphate maltosyltransferase [Corynebacterium pyruviciproducens]
MTGRIAIDDIRPVINCGSYPAKGAVGEVIPIFALVWREGHDAVGATCVVTDPHGHETAIPMVAREEEPDKFNALFVPDRMGMWSFRIEGWDHPMQSWRHNVEAKLDAGQSEQEMANDIEIGALLCTEAGLTDVVTLLHSDAPLADKIHTAMQETKKAPPLRHFLTRTSEFRIFVERRKALVSSWYEIFPRSTGGVDGNGKPIHGTFATTADELPRIKEMGFDTVYLPPIHPIGKINRKGKDNTLIAEPDDVGSPWAIGSDEGGHEAVHPALGTVEDFEALVKRAEDLGMEIAIDLALQCAPDHPWAKEHPEFFTILPDNTIAFAENPPKKYQDIYPLNFDNARKTIYNKILELVLLWIRRGVKTFRVDNPHTKPANFWHWLISEIHAEHPDVIFLAEAFTRPPRLYGLSKVGFSQSYNYFTWKTTKRELTEFATEISSMADVSRANLFTNTPDILHASLQYGGRAMFAIRATLAATMSPVWGIYSGFELFEHEAVAPGSEEYKHSEKYELRPRDFSQDNLSDYIGLLNLIRRKNPALEQLRFIHFHELTNDQMLAYSKVDPETGNVLLIVVNLDSHYAQSGMLTLDMDALGLDESATFPVHDLISGEDYEFSKVNYVRLEPFKNVAHIFELPTVAPERRAPLAWR